MYGTVILNVRYGNTIISSIWHCDLILHIMLALGYYHSMMLRGDQSLLRGHDYSTETTSCWHNSSLGFRNARVPTDPKLRVVYLANYGVSYGSPPSLTQGKSKVSRFLQSLQTFWPPKASPKDVRLPFTPSQISVLLSWAYESPDLVFWHRRDTTLQTRNFLSSISTGPHTCRRTGWCVEWGLWYIRLDCPEMRQTSGKGKRTRHVRYAEEWNGINATSG